MLEKIVWGLFCKLPESWRNHEGTMKEPKGYLRTYEFAGSVAIEGWPLCNR